MRRFLETISSSLRGRQNCVQRIDSYRAELAQLNDAELRAAAGAAQDLERYLAAVAVVAARTLGLEMFGVQLQGAVALAGRRIAEMQTGEGKTLVAAPAAAWLARGGNGVHVITVNDYLARRDAAWMGGIYRFLGYSVGYVAQGMTPEARRAAYACDITYSSANEIGFDLLRDRLALHRNHQVHRPFHAAIVDEADSILIDEARIPLVIAGGTTDGAAWAFAAAPVVRWFRPGEHYTVEASGRNVALTDAGIRAVEHAFNCGNLFEERNLALHEAVQYSLHAHALLRRDVDYLVKDGAIEMVDELKGRVAQDRRWPAGLHTAVEAKEGVAPKLQGRILGSTSMQNMMALYPHLCGMTATAHTQELELRKIYGLEVETIPTHRPVIRVDRGDALFDTQAEKETAVIAEIRRAHLKGQPVLVGTASVEESERLSSRIPDVPHHVLNARHEEAEAAIIACAGQRGAVTISTNMAGRGVDIQLGDGVAALGGLYVIGTNRHESRRIDNQLRGRAGRQGDPGESRYFISRHDPLLLKYRELDPELKDDPATIQRLVEGQHLDARLFLHSYDVPLEGQRNQFHTLRQEILERSGTGVSTREQMLTLRAMDDIWADYLSMVDEFRSGTPWLSYAETTPYLLSMGRRDAHSSYLHQIDQWYRNMMDVLPAWIEQRAAELGEQDPEDRGAVWTYLITDRPFGSWLERVVRGLKRRKQETL